MSRRRWLLATALVAGTSLGVGPCPLEEAVRDTLVRISVALGEHDERIDRLESCTCCCEGTLAPVCAANGRTYTNACEARCADVEIVSRGRCPADLCGGPEGIRCGEGELCELPPGCDAMSVGMCEEKPDGCFTDEYVPVCGCDGMTYGNDCERRLAGVPLAHRGECDRPEECRANDDCRAGQFCQKDAGACDGGGVCHDRPDACPEVFDPVCGCDGQTYVNRCEAAAAGVSVAHRGECREPPRECTENSECADTEFCHPPAGMCDEAGVCLPRPDACPLVLDPVCGCDGMTYGNRCEAAAAGVGVAHDGRCDEPPLACADSGDCERDEFCRKEAGECRADGWCEPRPEVCPLFFAPVCGCDGVTYGNACEAARHGASIAHEGRCDDGCRDHADCPNGWCARPPGQCGGEGVCRPLLTDVACLQIYDPVCGCDDHTYGNACEADLAAVSIRREGPCVIGAVPDGN